MGAVLVRFFRFFNNFVPVIFNHVFLLSASRSINCAASSERVIMLEKCVLTIPELN